MTELQSPLRLVVGTHPAWEGIGCVMNLMCWEQGQTKDINDNPDGWHPVIRNILINLNDRYCTHMTRSFSHKTGRDILYICPDCSTKLIDLAHLTDDSCQLLASLLVPNGVYREIWDTADDLQSLAQGLRDPRFITYSDAQRRVQIDLVLKKFIEQYTAIKQAANLPAVERPYTATQAAQRMITAGRG